MASAGELSSKSSSSSIDEVNGDVVLGPDLNQSRSSMDRKVYRQIIIRKNGLRALLISDTVAMGQKTEQGEFGPDESGYDSETSSIEIQEGDGDANEWSDVNDGEENSVETVDDEEDEEEGEQGIRHAAAALSVGCGSYHDPEHAQGLAHFLEHMLFMGTERYPEENAYSAFVSRCGGSDNAYTELEETVYHFEVPQETLSEALDMFSQFFVSPLLKEEAAGRELNSIESEFQLSKNTDGCRLQQLMCHTAKSAKEHPFGKFSWGNLQSLKTDPEKNCVNMMSELRKFYDQYYYAANMRLVVCGAYSIDELQSLVVKCFSDVPAEPRVASPLLMISQNPGTWEETRRSPIADYGMPFPQASLGKIYRVVPVKDRHTLSITWQVPPQGKNWRSKPCDYIGHLLGHESQGSILSTLKERSWVTSCHAGVGSSGYENSSSHALFSIGFSLSEQGVSHWAEILSELYIYIGMIRHYCQSKEGLPSYVYEELRAIQNVAYKFQNEAMPDELVEDIVEEMMEDLPPQRLLEDETDESAVSVPLPNVDDIMSTRALSGVKKLSRIF